MPALRSNSLIHCSSHNKGHLTKRCLHPESGDLRRAARMFRRGWRAPYFGSAKSLGRALGNSCCFAWHQICSVRFNSGEWAGRYLVWMRTFCAATKPCTSRLRCAGSRSNTSSCFPGMCRSGCLRNATTCGADRSRLQLEMEIPQCDARDDRRCLPVEVILQHACVAPPRPRLAAVRPLAQSAFVEKVDRSPLFLAFLMCGQVTFFE